MVFHLFLLLSLKQQIKRGGEINWGVAIVDGIFGAIDGVLSASGLKLNPVLNTVLDVCLDVVNNSITTLIKNEGKLTLEDLENIGKSALITAGFSLISSGFKLGFDADFVGRVNKDIKNINKKLSKGLYKTTKQAIRAQKTIYSYINQTFNSKVFAQYGMDILSTIAKGIKL